MPYPGPALFPGPTTFPGFPVVFTPGGAKPQALIATFGGVQYDLSDDIVGSVMIEQQRRTTETEQPQPATLTVTLSNASGNYTPDNPGGIYYPYVTLQTSLTYSATKNGFTGQLFVGTVDGIQPTFTQSSKNGTVTFTASDHLGASSRQILKSDINERWNALTKSGSGTSDVWMFGEADGSTSFKNTGTGGLGLPAIQVKPTSGRGEMTRDEADGLIVEGGLTVTDNNGLGPVLLARHAPGQKCMMVWFKFDTPAPYLPDYDMVIAGRRGVVGGDDNGALIWHLRYAESAVGSGIFRLELRDSTNSVIGILDTDPHDGAWHNLFVWNDSPGRTGFYYDNSSVTISTSLNLADQEYIVAGGQMNPFVRGAQVHCMTATFAALMVTTVTVGGLEPYVQTGSVTTASNRWSDLMSWGTYGAAYAMVGADNRPVAVKSSMGRSQLDCLAELATTIGGTVWHNPATNRVELLTGPAWRPQTPSLVVTLELDDDIQAGHEWGLSLADSPTRATATCPDGDGVYISTAAETNGVRDAGSFDTCAASIDDAVSLASWQVNRVKRLSLSRFGVDAASSVNAAAMWGGLLTLAPGGRRHVINVDQAIFGISSFDVHVLGWTTEIGPEISRWTFDCLPADSPAEFTVGDDFYGRVGWNEGEALSSALAPSTTSLVITSSYPLTVDSGSYPLDLLIDGEVVTVPSPPGSATSPQTVTVSRARYGTLPVAHPAGRSVFMYPDVRVGP